MVTTSYRKETVRGKVAHQDQVHQTSEDEPGVVLDGGFLEGVVGADFGFQLAFDEVVHFGVRVLAGRGIHKDLGLLSPADQGVMVRLVVKKPSYPGVVACTPKQVDNGKDGNLGPCRQLPEQQDMRSQDDQDNGIGQVLGF